MTPLALTILPETFAVCRLDAAAPIPVWANDFCSVTRTADELSIVCAQAAVPDGIVSEKNWRALKIVGSLDFALTGILASIAAPLAHARIPIFALSTYDTDYVLVKANQLESAIQVLCQAGFSIEVNQP